ncbi:MAG: PD-(D/E)XK nuclease family protein, partial [Treponema sp.]|nr:PD-(D/E)XK nuclease family protein [Treponema sp.]
WALLKLLVYPEDRVAYGALLRSPLVRLGEEAFTLCMLRGGEIFDEALDGELPPPDRRRYREGRRLYRTLLADAGELSAAALITKLWYETGYRQEALWSAESQVYLDLYDLFFEQAQRMEERGQGLVDFLDYLEDLVRKDWGRGKEQISDSDLPGEEESGVRIMTIHRSKGLEFPVVFVYGGGSAENTGLEKGLALFSERRGIFLKLPAAEELEEGGNYFYLAEQDEHRDKTIAELRRLLYVAMTRAEQELYFTAVIPPQSKADLKTLNPEIFGPDEFIVERLEQYRTSEKNSVSFLRLLPPLSAENPLYTIAPIPAYPAETWRRLASAASGRSGESLSMKEAARMIRGEYRAIPAVPFPRFVPQIAAASALRPAGSGLRPAAGPRPAAAPYPDGSGVRSFRPPGTEVRGVQGELDFDGMEPPAISAGGQRAEDAGAELDELLRAAGLSAQDFGIIVHGFIEDRFNGRTPRLPRRFAVENEQYLAAVGGAARTMAEGFFASALGRKAAAAPFLKTEYPLLSAADCGQGRIVISGKIDLLFDDGKTVYVVDFKTGLDEDITRHVGQLAVYRRAAEDLFRKPVECRLFYLRGSREADISAELDKTTVEELAEIWLRENGSAVLR